MLLTASQEAARRLVLSPPTSNSASLESRKPSTTTARLQYRETSCLSCWPMIDEYWRPSQHSKQIWPIYSQWYQHQRWNETTRIETGSQLLPILHQQQPRKWGNTPAKVKNCQTTLSSAIRSSWKRKSYLGTDIQSFRAMEIPRHYVCPCLVMNKGNPRGTPLYKLYRYVPSHRVGFSKWVRKKEKYAKSKWFENFFVCALIWGMVTIST